MSAKIYLICGFIGFGKTTFARDFAKKVDAVRFTHDEIMVERYGRNPDNFLVKYMLVDEYIRNEAEKAVKEGKSVIMDYGFWSKQKRTEYYNWAKELTEEVYFYAVVCDIQTAKKRVLQRNKNNSDELFISEASFDSLLKQYEPISKEEGYPVIFYES